MVTKKDVVNTVVAELGNGKITLEEAVKKANAIKPLKNKRADVSWAYQFKTYANVVKTEEGTFVQGKVVVQTQAQVVVPEVVAPTTTTPVQTQ